MYLEQREHDRQLHATDEAIKQYEQQLGYLLNESEIYIWNYRPAENVVNMTRSPGRRRIQRDHRGVYADHQCRGTPAGHGSHPECHAAGQSL